MHFHDNTIDPPDRIKLYSDNRGVTSNTMKTRLTIVFLTDGF